MSMHAGLALLRGEGFGWSCSCGRRSRVVHDSKLEAKAAWAVHTRRRKRFPSLRSGPRILACSRRR